jgi:glycosyltransferase involved in cell wall biosynthesis
MHLKDGHEIVVDARWLRTGIGRYILTLLQELKPRLSGATLTGITAPEHVKTIEPYCDRVLRVSCDIYTVREQFSLPRIARHASVFCSPHYNTPLLRRGSLVVTVHDLTHLLFDAYKTRITSRLYAAPMLRMACARATRIVTPSNYTKQMMVEHLNADPDKISVIPASVDSVFQPQDRESAAEIVRLSYGISGPYILCVTATVPHKNLRRLLMAHQQLCNQNRDTPTLVLVLREDPASSTMDKQMRSLITRPQVRCLSGIPDASLASLYAGALITVMPSLEEGFGLPVVESMACGTPVACAHAASLPEVAGDAAIFFAPDSVDDMSSALIRLTHSTELRRQLSARGLKRAAMYSTSRAGEAYASMLSTVIRAQS